MYRVSMNNVFAERTLQPMFEQTSATPVPMLLDPSVTLNIFSGMVMARTGADTVALCDGGVSTDHPFGLAAMDHNDVIDDMNGLDITGIPFAVWIGGVDGWFSIFAPAFDTTASYVVPTNGSRQLLYAGTGASVGMLTTVTGNGNPVAELMEVISPTQITVRLIPPGATP